MEVIRNTAEVCLSEGFTLKKHILTFIILIIAVLYACNHIKETEEKIFDINQKLDINRDIESENNEYEIINKTKLNVSFLELFNEITEEDIFIYSEEVKGTCTVVLNKESVFPTDLVTRMEETLYNSTNYNHNNFIEEIMRNDYFKTINDLNSEHYRVELEEMYELFPDLQFHKDEIRSVMDSYEYIGAPKNCIDMFYISDTILDEDYYIFMVESGGSNGVVSIVTAKQNNNEFIWLYEFETQNGGYGNVIKYDDSFYYIFLQYNYNLKIYDGIRIHKLGMNADTDNILISYVADTYIWKNIRNIQINVSDEINKYIDSIKEIITSDKYLENGLGDDLYLFYGDEAEAKNFALADTYNQYYKIDYANIGIPIYIRKSNHIPSDYRSTWHLRAKFYVNDIKSNSVQELKHLELGKELPLNNELVQMWFKEIDGKIFTFCLYHISDYNYMLKVLLIERDKITDIRTDILSPQRKFALTEGEVFIVY